MAIRNTLGKTSVWVIVLFSILTGGIYPYCWYGLRLQTLQRLRTTQKISPRLAWSPLYFNVAAITAFLLFGVWEGFALVGVGLSWVVLILNTFLAFRVRRMLIDHFQATGLEVSGVRTFFFAILYLQYKMNRLPDVDAPQPVSDNASDSLGAEAVHSNEFAAEDPQVLAQTAKIQQLKELLDAGLLSQAEFDAKKGAVRVAERLGKLKRALDMGLLTQSEYELKERELSGADGPARKTLVAVS